MKQLAVNREQGAGNSEQLVVSSGRRIKLLALLSVILFLLFGCDNPFEPPQQKNSEAEKGSFSLSVDGVGTGRTILPATVKDDFEAYTLEFFTAGTTTYPVASAERINDDLGEPVVLEVGTYDLYVTAYMDTAKTEPAAYGKFEGIVIGAGAAVNKSVTLEAVADEGEGTFSWVITFSDEFTFSDESTLPDEITLASMTITPLGETVTEEQTLSFTDDPTEETEVALNDSLTLDAGYYRVVFKLNTSSQHAEHREILHVYQNIDSVFAYEFTKNDFNSTIIVTNGNNADAGSLRQAIADATSGDMIIIDPSVGTIALTARLEIADKSLIIEGNSVIITPGSPWTASTTSQLLYLSSTGTAKISRVHFKDGRSSGYGVAIQNNGNLTLESCIFSGNRVTGGSGTSQYGIVRNQNNSTTAIRGCTFYGNYAPSGGAISCPESTSTLTLEGNLFYGNTASEYPVLYKVGNTTNVVTNQGYNVVDVALGTGTTQSGFAAHTTKPDKGNIGLPISVVNFKLLSSSPAAGVITTRSADYPTLDFYGYAIGNGAAAGAVQQAVSGTGYGLVTSVNNTSAGSISTITPNPADDEEGLVSGTVSITATANAGYEFNYWLVNGVRNDSGNPLVLAPITTNTNVRAVFMRVIEVTVFTDDASNNNVAGTLRYALQTSRQQDGDVIRFINVTPGDEIKLLRALPDIASTTGTKNITIEGNGITITRDPSWTESTTSQLLRINNVNVVASISRVHFKDGRATDNGAAIYISQANVTLESCIFSGNVNMNAFATNNSGVHGGAIYNTGGTLSVKGCTFYANKARISGGAIYTTGASAALTLEGNLFYGNTANLLGVVSRGTTTTLTGTVTSRGYNVVDVALGTGNTQSGFTASTNPNTDKGNVSGLPISPVNFKPLSGGAAMAVITTRPTGYPVRDFYDNVIGNGAAAGAVQTAASGSGYALGVSASNSAMGTASIATGTPNADGLYSGAVSITATETSPYSLVYWLVNGVRDNSGLTLNLNIAAHTYVQAVFKRVVAVNVFSDVAGSSATTAGTLRYAFTNARDGDLIRFDPATAGTSTITLTSQSPAITGARNVTIEGNGITITGSSRVVYLSDSSRETVVSVSRVHFKDCPSRAVYIQYGTFTLESCIFSGTAGAIDNANISETIVRGCTFYNNTGINRGSAITNSGTGTLTLEGNLFYGNTTTHASGFPVEYRAGGTVTSLGYNVVDVALGSGSTQCGFASSTIKPGTDKGNVSGPLVSPLSFKLFSGSAAAGIITTLPAGYPAKDFYGDTISDGAAAGAVQGVVSGGYLLMTSVNDSNLGSINITTPANANADGLYSGTVTITATPTAYGTFTHWLKNGVQDNSTSPLSFTISEHTTVQAVFSPVSNAREVTIAMWDSAQDTWNNDGAIRINVNGTDRATNAKKAVSGSAGPVYYTFYVFPSNVVILYWVASATTFQYENAFAVYYTDDPPSPAFSPTNNAAVDTTGRLLVYKQYNNMNSIADGATLGTFTVP